MKIATPVKKLARKIKIHLKDGTVTQRRKKKRRKDIKIPTKVENRNADVKYHRQERTNCC